MKTITIKDGQFILGRTEPTLKKIMFDVYIKHDIAEQYNFKISVEAVNDSFATLKAIAYLDNNPNYNLNCWEVAKVEPKPINRIYRAYICSGDRESGAYTAIGKNFIDAAANLAKHWSSYNPLKTYGTQWKNAGRKEGNPKNHLYVADEKGNMFLLIDTGERTCYQPNF
jgi:hypothetical protein